MTTEQLIEGLRTTTLPADSFHHQDHLHAAWGYLDRWPLAEVLSRFPADLQRFAEKAGAPGLYHATITWAYLLALHQCRLTLGPDHTWPELNERFPELFDWPGFLERSYSREVLDSDLARAEFVLPDRLQPTPVA